MTVNEVIRRAMRAIGVLHHSENPTAEEAADALDTLNDMLNAWRNEGVDLEHLTLVVTDELPYPDDHVAAIRYNLAVELAAEFGVQVTPVVVAKATESFMALKTQYLKVPTLKTDDALYPIYNPNFEDGFYKDFS